MKALKAVGATLLLTGTQIASAHPGHGAEHANDVLHPFLGMEHVALLAVIGLAVGFAHKCWVSRSDNNSEE